MPRTLHASIDPALPRLAWIARHDLARRQVSVRHGAFVEVDPSHEPRWIAACVWDRPFAAGTFHESEHVFGSGVVVTGEQVFYVPPSTTMDRLLYVREGDVLFVSNSLPVILAAIGARLSPSFDYREVSESSGCGIDAYLREIPVQHPQHAFVTQVIYDQLVVARDVVGTRRRSRPHTFATTASYLDAIRGVLARVLENARDPKRRRGPRAVSNVSRGYDSPAVTALVTEQTSVTSYTARRSNTRLPEIVARRMEGNILDDDGSQIARQLGAEVRYLDPDCSDLAADFERWLWAGGQLSPELLFWRLFADAEAADTLTLWFSGHFGGGVWDTQMSERMRAGQLARSMPAGCGLTEARLRYGVIDCSLAYLFAESAAQIHALSRSPEMAPWRLDNGYDRPIPRHVLETRGIAREAFGFGKRAVAQDFDTPQGAALQKELVAAGGVTAAEANAVRAANFAIYFSNRALAFVRARGSRSRMMRLNLNVPKDSLRALNQRWNLRRHTFVHCVNAIADGITIDRAAFAAPEESARSVEVVLG
jgi:hypothetical protein